jgi:hypothetical protein
MEIMSNLSLERLQEAAGVFISESNFQVIEMGYIEGLKRNNLEDSEELAEQFIEEWIEEQEVLCTFSETSDGNIKYFSAEGMEEVRPSTNEFLKQMDMTSYHWENMCRSYWRIFEEIYNTGNVDKELLKNILAERTISHEQIYELQKAVKNRVAELLGQ